MSKCIATPRSSALTGSDQWVLPGRFVCTVRTNLNFVPSMARSLSFAFVCSTLHVLRSSALSTFFFATGGFFPPAALTKTHQTLSLSLSLDCDNYRPMPLLPIWLALNLCALWASSASSALTVLSASTTSTALSALSPVCHLFT